jgi:hypothetical protein
MRFQHGDEWAARFRRTHDTLPPGVKWLQKGVPLVLPKKDRQIWNRLQHLSLSLNRAREATASKARRKHLEDKASSTPAPGHFRQIATKPIFLPIAAVLSVFSQ